MHDYNSNARAYWWILAVIGYGLLANALLSIAALPVATVFQIALITAFVCVVAFFPVKIPGTTLSFASGEIFIFLALMLYGVEAAAIAAATEGALGAVRGSKRWTSWFGSPAMAAIATSISGYAFLAVRNALEQHAMLNGATLPLLLTLFAIVYFALCNVLPSMLLALKRNDRLDVPGLLKDRNWMAITHICSIAIASLIQLADPKVDAWALFAALPVIVILHWTARSTLKHVESQLRA